MTFKAQINHMAELLGYMRQHFNLLHSYMLSNGMYMVQFKNEECWTILQDGGKYLLSKINSNDCFKIIYETKEQIYMPEYIAQKIANRMGIEVTIDQ